MSAGHRTASAAARSESLHATCPHAHIIVLLPPLARPARGGPPRPELSRRTAPSPRCRLLPLRRPSRPARRLSSTLASSPPGRPWRPPPPRRGSSMPASAPVPTGLPFASHSHGPGRPRRLRPSPATSSYSTPAFLEIRARSGSGRRLTFSRNPNYFAMFIVS